MQDMWTDVFAVPGKRTSGTQAGLFAVLPPGWDGDLPAGVDRIQATTPMAWVIGRTQTDGADDYPSVHEVQDGFAITPTVALGTAAAASRRGDGHGGPDRRHDHRPGGAGQPDARQRLLRLRGRPDERFTRRTPRTGQSWRGCDASASNAGRPYDAHARTRSIGQALDQAAADGQQAMRTKVPTLAPLVNGWQVPAETMGVYGNHYLKRATLAMVGLGSNPPEDAIYPLAFTDGDGNPLDGEHDYRLHFDASSCRRRRRSGHSPCTTAKASRYPTT